MNASPPTARFIVGIDLGTTNSAVAFAELADPDTIPSVGTFPVPQPVAPGEIEMRETLPSFHYEPAPGDGLDEPDARRLPWGEAPGFIVGLLARERGMETPGRLIASAKSWLSHTGVDRSADLLPWHGAGDVKKLSPAEASARYLDHLRAAWDHAHPGAPLAAQEVVITIPASFDEVARGLTLAAARRAGLPRVSLLEEPQAAFYAWMAKDAARAGLMEPGERILVCDIGGGTTDFTLIEARGENGGSGFHRVAVGDHLILGGDNLDLALAHHVEAQIGPPTLTPRQWGTLVRRCQGAKETLLGPEAPERLTVSVPSAAGARLVGGARTVELARAEVTRLLVDGFLPWVELDAQPTRRASGFQEFGLPYAPDAGITRYLAAFLHSHGGGRLDAVLLNGGFFESRTLRDRLLVVLESWFGGEPPRVLENARLDLAVALGAVRYGLARRGVGGARKITGGLARAFYVGVHQGDRDVALCLAPAGLEEDAEVTLEGQRFELRVRQPAEFPLWSSSTRLQDKPGDVLPADDPGLAPLPPLRTALRGRAADETPGAAGDAVIPVRLRARLTELGTLEVWCAEENGTRQWKLPFDVRATLPDADAPPAAEAGPAVLLDEETAGRARDIVRQTFGRTGTPPDAESLNKRLETLVGSPRVDWPPALLRELGDELPPLEDSRRRAPAFETRWLNFFGFCLRPGYGCPGDDVRVAAAWRLCGERRFSHPRHEPTRAEWAVLWRRLAAGLSAGQQRSLAAPLLADLRRNGGRDWAKQETAETWRLLGALELLDPAVRLDLGERLLGTLGTPDAPSSALPMRAALWALGRLGARAPLAGPLNAVLPAETIENWIERLLPLDFTAAREEFAFTLTQLARRTGDRYRDLSEPTRSLVLTRLADSGAEPHALELVREGGRLQTAEREAAFGESLPRGLRLV